MIAGEAYLPDPLLKAGKLILKCPACTALISVPQKQIDPVVGLNMACPECKNISHIPGDFHAEPLPPGYMITGAVRVPIAGFSDWYYENPFIIGLIHKGQADLLEVYGLWGFCSTCHHPFPASELISLAADQSMVQRGTNSNLLATNRSTAEEDMPALQAGLCPRCGSSELMVIAAVVPEGVRIGVSKIKKLTTCVSANKCTGNEIENEPKKSKRGLLAILAAACAMGLLVWVLLNQSVLPFIKVHEPTTTLPDPILSPTSTISMISNPTPSVVLSQSETLCWTYKLDHFDGTRAQVWETVLKDETKKFLRYDQFLVDVVERNPQLKDDGYVFYGNKTYVIPEICH